MLDGKLFFLVALVSATSRDAIKSMRLALAVLKLAIWVMTSSYVGVNDFEERLCTRLSALLLLLFRHSAKS